METEDTLVYADAWDFFSPGVVEERALGDMKPCGGGGRREQGV